MGYAYPWEINRTEVQYTMLLHSIILLHFCESCNCWFIFFYYGGNQSWRIFSALDNQVILYSSVILDLWTHISSPYFLYFSHISPSDYSFKLLPSFFRFRLPLKSYDRCVFYPLCLHLLRWLSRFLFQKSTSCHCHEY